METKNKVTDFKCTPTESRPETVILKSVTAKMEIGDRVFAIRDGDLNAKTVNLYGFGVYAGEHDDPETDGWPPSSRLDMDRGGYVWGRECWYGFEKEFVPGVKSNGWTVELVSLPDRGE